MSEAWIDVSAHQGGVDWPKVAASGVKGAVLRAGYGDNPSQQDARFAANIAGAPAAGMKAAVYWFSYADSEADARKEWAICERIIRPYGGRIAFVAYDYEYDSARYYRQVHGADPTAALINGMAGAFLGAAKAAGWKTVLYANVDYLRNVFSAATLAMWDLWLADYSGEAGAACALRQTGRSGKVPGVSGEVDLDTAFQDFAPPGYACDTSGTVEVARGAAYQIGITAASAPKVAAGTGGIVTILPRSNAGSKWYYYLVPIGKPGDETGIYINGGPRQLIVKIGQAGAGK